MFKPDSQSDNASAAPASATPGCTDTAPWNCRSADDQSLIVSPADPFSYQQLQLDNGLQVLLVSTPNTDKAAAAMTVATGSGDDPKGREGLAHFLEHMLFLGTEPYPQAGEYQAYISRHGGNHNAFTANQQTTYFFSIDNDAMAGALDRFAPFFISPTFDAAYVDREKNAVNAEYTAKIRDDFRRIYSAEKQAYNPDHPYSHFSVGNLDTLADRPNSKVRDDLINFYNSHYSADRMTLVLAGNYPLEQLKQWASSHFSAVPKRQVEVVDSQPPQFVPGQLPLDMNIEPVKEIRRLQFTFPMPESQSLYESKPLSLLSSLIGHEGEGSLLALLKEKGWAEGLSAGRSINTRFEANLVIQVQLTQAGLLHVENITQMLEHYFGLLKKGPLPQYLMTEQEQLNEIAFRFMEHGSLSDYAVRLSSNMQLYPVPQIIHGDYLALPISQTKLQPYLDALSMNNVLRTLIAPGVATDTSDPWYNTPMRIRPMDYQPDQVVTKDLEQLSLPAPNPFIPEHFGLNQEPEQTIPSKLIDQDGQQLWYYPEHEFKQPKSRILIELQHADNANARSMAIAQLYTRAVNENLSSYSYPAQLAGLAYNLVPRADGYQLLLSGYEDKLPELLQRILDSMQHLSLTDEQFERYKASLKRRLENALKSKPYERGLAELKRWINTPSFSEAELLEALDSISRTDVEVLANTLKGQTTNRIYVHGSMSADDATKVAAQVNSYYPGNPDDQAIRDVVHLPEGQYVKDLQLDHDDEVMVLYLQGQDNSDHNRARFALLGQMISAPYYQYMRTEQQLGYIVFAAAFPQRSVPGLIFIVQSPAAQPANILKHSEIFWKTYQDTLASMSEEEFTSFKEGLISRLLEPANNMGEKADRFWANLDMNRTSFDNNEAIAAEVKQLSLAEIQQLYQRLIIDAEVPRVMFSQGQPVDWQPLDQVIREQQPTYNLKQ
ncbi:insulinase family protein [Oceanobacter mangrovi]|uniref:insulinase family protein n=1 Tax=Oceanobacter mangrovi TaxID=2862510 RepID=UPI001C8EB36A|nr:insulinase family protein [Oceanobacter mangrovi]